MLCYCQKASAFGGLRLGPPSEASPMDPTGGFCPQTRGTPLPNGLHDNTTLVGGRGDDGDFRQTLMQSPWLRCDHLHYSA